MALKYTEEQLNSLDRETLTRLFLSQQEQLENIDHTLQLVLEQMADLKRHRFGRSTEKHETEDQISFMEVDGKIVFFNEAEAVAAEGNTQEEPESVSRSRLFSCSSVYFEAMLFSPGILIALLYHNSMRFSAYWNQKLTQCPFVSTLYHGYGIFADPSLPDVRHNAYG